MTGIISKKLIYPAGSVESGLVEKASLDVQKFVGDHPTINALSRHKPHLLIPSVYDLIFDKTMQGTVGEFLGCEFFMWFSVLFIKGKNSKGYVPWHYDDYFWATNYTAGCTAWLALETVDTDMGPMIFCDQPIETYQHSIDSESDNMLARGNVSDFSPPEGVEVHEACLKKGEFSIHSTDIWHSSKPNSSGKDRLAVAYRFITADAEPQRFKFLKRGAVGNLRGSQFFYQEVRPQSEIGTRSQRQYRRSVRLSIFLQLFGDKRRSLIIQIKDLFLIVFSKKGLNVLSSLTRFIANR